VAHRVSRGFVARGRQQNEERRNLRRRQALTVQFGPHQVRRQVICGPGPVLFGQIHAVLGEFR